MTLLQTRKTVLKHLAEELNAGCFAIYQTLSEHGGAIDPREIKRSVEELDVMMAYVKSEAENIARECVAESAQAVNMILYENGE
ncbi:MAG: hypothetical protein LBT81_05905 [Helicobacteraceae bacterium]|jgi:predicted transcriptional regulator|nr:hypothetical protein [Helicobacteraceae bacterium]